MSNNPSEFWPTESQRELVGILRAAKMPAEEIARALSIDVDTLRRHFADELRYGGELRIGELAQVLYRAAAGGDVEANKLIAEMNDRDPAKWSLPNELRANPR